MIEALKEAFKRGYITKNEYEILFQVYNFNSRIFKDRLNKGTMKMLLKIKEEIRILEKYLTKT